MIRNILTYNQSHPDFPILSDQIEAYVPRYSEWWTGKEILKSNVSLSLCFIIKECRASLMSYNNKILEYLKLVKK